MGPRTLPSPSGNTVFEMGREFLRSNHNKKIFAFNSSSYSKFIFGLDTVNDFENCYLAKTKLTPSKKKDKSNQWNWAIFFVLH